MIALLVLLILSIIASVSCLDKDPFNTIHSFLEWFSMNGGIANGVSVGSFDDMGLGVKCTKDISSGSEVLEVPKHLIFSLPSLQTSKDPLHVKIAKEFSASSEDAVIGCLLAEKLRQDSFFAPYIAVLPEHVNSPINFSTKELASLQSKSMEDDAKKLQLQSKTNFVKFRQKLERCIPKEIFVRISYDEYVWASTIVDSRGLRFRGMVYLVPFADMFNYEPHPDARKSAAGEFYLKHHKLTEEKLTILADRNQVAGGQLFEDYGDNDDKIYLQYHGFVASSNPFRCLSIEAADPSQYGEATQSFLTALKFTKAAPQACISATGELGKTLDVYLTATTFTPTERKACWAVVEKVAGGAASWNDVFEDCGFSAVSAALVKKRSNSTVPLADLLDSHKSSLPVRVLRTIQDWLVSSEPQWATSIEEDNRILAELSSKLSEERNRSDGHTYVAVTYRVTVKKMWKHLISLYRVDEEVNSDSTEATLEAQVGILGTAEIPSGTSTAGTTRTPVTLPAKQTQATDSVAEAGAEAEASSIDDDDEYEEEEDDEENESLTLEEKLESFNAWFNAANPSENSLVAATHPIFRIGTMATKDIKAGQVYLAAPLEIILDSDKAFRDANVGTFLKAVSAKFNGGRDDMHELLFFLLHERFVQKSKSLFWPYLRLLPTARELDVPSLWTDEEVTQRFGPSFVGSLVTHYRANIRKTYEYIMNVDVISLFLTHHGFTYDDYLWATTILDSRSIWWESKRHLVPMLDFINCQEGPDPKVVHSTIREGPAAVTKAPWNFTAGEQVFENYGQPNHIYFTYHGFILSEEYGGNSHDCVHTELALTPKEIKALDKSVAKPLAKINEVNDQPNPTTRAMLAEILQARLSLYENHTTSHRPTQEFLASEVRMLQKVKSSLLQ